MGIEGIENLLPEGFHKVHIPKRYKFVIGCYDCQLGVNAQKNLVGEIVTQHLLEYPSHKVRTTAIEIPAPWER